MAGIAVAVLANGKKEPKKMAMTEAQKRAAAKKRAATNEAKRKAAEAKKRKAARTRAANALAKAKPTRRTTKRNPSGMTKQQMKEILAGGAIGALLTAALDYWGAEEEMMATPKDRAIAYGALAGGLVAVGLASKKAARVAFPAAVAPAGASATNLVNHLAEGKAGETKDTTTTHARATAARVQMPVQSTAARVPMPRQLAPHVDLSHVVGTAARVPMPAPRYWPTAAE